MAKKRKAVGKKKAVAPKRKKAVGAKKKKPVAQKKKKAIAAKKKKPVARKRAAKVAIAAGGPPGGVLYRCEPAGAPGSNQCLRFDWNPRSQWWDWPPDGTPVNCSDCKWWFDENTPRSQG
jgi:hypothetical protein